MVRYFCFILILLFIPIKPQASPGVKIQLTRSNWIPVRKSVSIHELTLAKQPNFVNGPFRFRTSLLGRSQSSEPLSRNRHRHRSPVPKSVLGSRSGKECKGVDNFLGDIGVISYGLGFIGTFIGFVTMLVSFVTQAQTVLSTYLVGIPSSILTLNNWFGNPSAVPIGWANAIGLFGVIDTFINLTFATNVNGLVNIGDIFGAIISFSSLYIGAASTFPDSAKYILKEIFGSDLEVIFRTYGCS